MKTEDIEEIGAWLVRQGLAGAAETELLEGFCRRCRAAGMDVSRGFLIVDTLHPVYEGRAFRWRSDQTDEPALIEYGRTNEGEAAANWRRTTFHHLVETGADELRRRIGFGDATDLAPLETLKTEGYTDNLTLIHRFAGSALGEMDCVYSSWATRHPRGFVEAELAALRRLVPSLALAVKAASLSRVAATLVEVYLGRDGGRRVLSGRIARGVADRIDAVLWFSDLRGYTTISDSAAPDQIIPLLNDYAHAVVSAVHGSGGDVLKLIGDGALAIFTAEDPAEACRAALRAEAALRLSIGELNARRAGENRPVTSVYLGLHIGEVFYGNIGSDDRLDFTVVGPAVNEVARIASMCRSVDRGVVRSAAFAAATPEPERAQLVSVGRYALRGIGRAQELFTLDPELVAGSLGAT